MLPWTPPPAPSGFDADSVSPSVLKQTPAALLGSIQNHATKPPALSAPSAPSAPSAHSATGSERAQADQSGGKKPRTHNTTLRTATRTADRPSAPPSAPPSVPPSDSPSVKEAYSSGVILLESIADDLLGVYGAGSYFVCPLQACSERTDSEAILHDFWLHCADKQHRKGLFNQGHLLREFGCQQGFGDAAHRLHHYAQMDCIKDILPLGDCTQPGCGWVQAGRVSGHRARTVLLNHYVTKHAPAAYEKDDVEFKDD